MARPPRLREAILTLARQGMNGPAIADQTGAQLSYVWDACRRHGVRLKLGRPRGPTYRPRDTSKGDRLIQQARAKLEHPGVHWRCWACGRLAIGPVCPCGQASGWAE